MQNISVRHVMMVLALGFVVAGLALAVFHVVKGHWWSAVTFLMLGFLAGIYWLPDLIQKLDPPIEWKMACMLPLLTGVMAVFVEHPAFDRDRQDGHNEARGAFAKIGLLCRPTSPELLALMDEGLKACSLQDYSAMADAINELHKAQSLGPTLSIVDGVRSAARRPNGDWCAETYLATRRLCPGAFLGMTTKGIAALEKKAD